MGTNVEIKARVADFNRVRERAEALSDTPGELIPQRDTFFHTPKGRLKLRLLAPDQGQLIYYERQDGAAPKPSHYILSPTSEPDSLESTLSACLGVRGVVRKRRLLYKVGNTRIHLDQVDGLGPFLELEVVLEPDQGVEQGRTTALELMQRLGVDEKDLVEGAYIDLLESRSDGS